MLTLKMIEDSVKRNQNTHFPSCARFDEMTLLEEVLHLATLVPGPPDEPLPAGIPDAEIDSFSRRTGIAIPSELRDWLRFTNGPCIGPGGIFGIHPRREHLDIEGIYEFVPEFKTNNWIPVGTDGCGDYYVLAVTSPDYPLQPVYFVDVWQDGRYSVPTYAVASSFLQFLRFLFRQELEREPGWPFDSTMVLVIDPELAKVKSAKMPWVA